jgi:hypothetical protein
MKRHLSLKSEYLAPLTSGELSNVFAAGSLTGVYPTINRDCPTVQPCANTRACPTLDGCFTGTTTTS